MLVGGYAIKPASPFFRAVDHQDASASRIDAELTVEGGAFPNPPKSFKQFSKNQIAPFSFTASCIAALTHPS